MFRFKTGFCPVHNENVEVTVEYVTVKSIGTSDTEKVGSFKCGVSDNTRPECSRCPIVFPNTRRP